MKLLLQHTNKYFSLVLGIVLMIIREQPAKMITAMVLLFVAANLDAGALFLMVYPFKFLPAGDASSSFSDPSFRWAVGLCFSGAIVTFVVAAFSVVVAVSLTVSAGKTVSLKIGAQISELMRSDNIVALSILERNLIQTGGIEQTMRRSLRSLVRAAFLLPRIINFGLTGIVGFGAVVWLNPKFGLFALVGLFLIVPPLYAMNRGVLKLMPIMERTMKKSQKKLAGIFSGDKNTEGMFDVGGDFSETLRIMGHFMTVRYRGAVIRSLFMSACLVAVGVYIIVFDSIDYGIIIPLLVALKMFAASLQNITRMSVGVSRTLVDAAPALLACNPKPCVAVERLTWPLHVDFGSDSLEINDGDKIGLFCKGLIANVAIALVAARIKDDNGIELDVSNLSLIQNGAVFADANNSKFQLLQAKDIQEAKLLVDRRKINILERASSSTDENDKSEVERELELELELDLG